MTYLLEARDLRIRYPGADRDAVCGVSLGVRRGETLGVRGGVGLRQVQPR